MAKKSGDRQSNSLAESLLAGLAEGNATPDARDARELARAHALEPDDMLIQTTDDSEDDDAQTLESAEVLETKNAGQWITIGAKDGHGGTAVYIEGVGSLVGPQGERDAG